MDGATKHQAGDEGARRNKVEGTRVHIDFLE
jgi:hypothetical protein